MSSSASSGCLPLISPIPREVADLWTEPPRPPVLSPHPSAPAAGSRAAPSSLPAISPAGSGSPSHAVAAAAPRPAHWAGPSSDSRADATTNPWSLRPPTGTEPTAAGSASPTGPGWSARSEPGSRPGTLPNPAAVRSRNTSSWRNRPANPSTISTPVNSVAELTR